MRLLAALISLSFSSMILASESASLDQAIEFSRSRSLNAANVDWEALEKEAKGLVASQGEDAAIRFVVKALGDNHSFYRAPARPLHDVLAPHEGFPRIRINGWSGSVEAARASTEALRSSIDAVGASGQCGLIVDLASNTGGNIWPMLVGLSPLLSEGLLGQFRSADGSSRAIEKKDGFVFFNGERHPFNPPGVSSGVPIVQKVALVVGPRTSSSGEILAILFRGQNGVKIFGAETSGQSTATSTVSLPNGGSLSVASSVTVDRAGTAFNAKLAPDVTTDEPLNEASEWLSSACGGRK
jgi:carboxyl-terminal processing protease